MHSKQSSLVRPGVTYLHHDLVALITRRRRLRLWIGRAVGMAGMLALVMACLTCIDDSKTVGQVSVPNEISLTNEIGEVFDGAHSLIILSTIYSDDSTQY